MSVLVELRDGSEKYEIYDFSYDQEQITLYLLITIDYITIPGFSTNEMVAAHERSFGLGYPRGSVLLDSVDGL